MRKGENGKVIVNERFLPDVASINAFLDRLGGAEVRWSWKRLDSTSTSTKRLKPEASM